VKISSELLRLLNSVAEQENRLVDDVVESVLRRYAIAHQFPVKPPTPDEQPTEDQHPFLVIARAADELGENSNVGNIAERSREILATEIPETLMQRLRASDADEK
jgi:hypothetical protein